MLSVSALICSGHSGRSHASGPGSQGQGQLSRRDPKEISRPAGARSGRLICFGRPRPEGPMEADDRGAAGRRRSPEAVPEERWERRSAGSRANQAGTLRRPGTRRQSTLSCRFDRSSERSSTFWRCRRVRVVGSGRTRDNRLSDPRPARGRDDARSRPNHDHRGDQIPA
jgi:hypothetical protein